MEHGVFDMDKELLKNELIRDEGCVFEVYLDSEGLPTFGIGHLCKPEEDEFGAAVGTKVSPERVNECFEHDVEIAVNEAKSRYDFFDDLNDVRQRVYVNMTFNLGSTRLALFKKMHAAVAAGNWHVAAAEMLDSKWAKQVKGRADRRADMMRSGTV